MSDIVERWPNYTEQSWSERFAELDKAFKHQQSIIDGLVKQLIAKSAELAEARDKAFDEAAEAVCGYIHPAYGELPGEPFASAAIRALKSPKPPIL